MNHPNIALSLFDEGDSDFSLMQSQQCLDQTRLVGTAPAGRQIVAFCRRKTVTAHGKMGKSRSSARNATVSPECLPFSRARRLPFRSPAGHAHSKVALLNERLACGVWLDSRKLYGKKGGENATKPRFVAFSRHPSAEPSPSNENSRSTVVHATPIFRRERDTDRPLPDQAKLLT